MLVTEQKSVLSFFTALDLERLWLPPFLKFFFNCSLTDKPLIQQAAHILPLKSSFPIALHTDKLEGKRWEVLSTHLVETIPPNMGTQKSSHNEPMDLQPIHPPPSWRERREALEAHH